MLSLQLSLCHPTSIRNLTKPINRTHLKQKKACYGSYDGTLSPKTRHAAACNSSSRSGNDRSEGATPGNSQRLFRDDARAPASLWGIQIIPLFLAGVVIKPANYML